MRRPLVQRSEAYESLGQCYPRETLVALLKFCASKGIHLISDEIYALSVYSRDGDGSEKFTSLRAVDPSGIIDPSQVHILHGMSKVGSVHPVTLGLSNGIRTTQQRVFDLDASLRRTKSFPRLCVPFGEHA